MIDEFSILKDFIIQNCIHFSYDSVDGPKNLENQTFIFDLRELTMHPEMGPLAAKLIWSRIKKYEPTCLFTYSIGGAPLLTYIQMLAKSEGIDLYILVVRESRKTSNRRRLVEGIRPPKNSRSIFVDDLVNTGDNYNQSIASLEEEGIFLRHLGAAGILTLWAYSGTRLLEAQGKVADFLFRRHDLGITRAFPTEELFGDLKYQIATPNSSTFSDIKSPPLIKDSCVYWASDDQTVSCLNMNTNLVTWQWSIPFLGSVPDKGIITKISDDDVSIFVNTYSGVVYRLNKQTGDVIWASRVGEWTSSSVTLSVDKQRAFIGTEDGNKDENSKGHIVCIDTSSGLEIWRKEFSSKVSSTPHAMDTRIICGSNDNVITCLNSENGNIWWQTTLKDSIKGKVNSIGPIIGATTENGYFYLIDSKTGSILFETISAKEFKNSFVATYDDTFIVLDTDGLVKAYDTTGKLMWLNRIRGSLSWYPEIVNSTLVITSDLGYVLSLDATTGEKLKYSYVVKDDGSGANKTIIHCPAAISDSHIAFNTTNKGLIVYDFSN